MTGKPQGALLEFKVFLLVFHHWSADTGGGVVKKLETAILQCADTIHNIRLCRSVAESGGGVSGSRSIFKRTSL